MYGMGETRSIMLRARRHQSTLGGLQFFRENFAAYLLLLVAGAGEPPPAAALCTHAIDKCFCTQNAAETHKLNNIKVEKNSIKTNNERVMLLRINLILIF
jgi:hypothetical protein